jgi:hypothetical protein
MQDADRRTRRLDRLRQELDDVGVEFAHRYGERLLAEIDRARFPPLHEGRFASYGAIVAEDADQAIPELHRIDAQLFDVRPTTTDALRRFADGVHSFLLVTPKRLTLVLLRVDVLREIELVQLRRSFDRGTSIVNRSSRGIVRIVQDQRIVTFDGTNWWVKPDAREYTNLVRIASPTAPAGLTEHILDFCVHVAGPDVGGSILVWCLDAAAEAQLDEHSRATEPRLAIGLPLGDERSHACVRHVLAQTDGACRLTREGAVAQVGLHLHASAGAHGVVDVRNDRGTRHAAGKRCSFDVPTALVFVISEDGPVTVFARGKVVASIDMFLLPVDASTA